VIHPSIPATHYAIVKAESGLPLFRNRNGSRASGITTTNIIVDGPATLSVATWAYSHAAQLAAAVWVSGKVVESLTGRWRLLLGTP
jgi:hypothetical protein